MVNTEYFDPIDADSKITFYDSSDYGGSVYVGENFGCIHFEEKDK
jgi:hypothetical protein